MVNGILVGDKILVVQILLKNLIGSDIGSQSSSVLWKGISIFRMMASVSRAV